MPDAGVLSARTRIVGVGYGQFSLTADPSDLLAHGDELLRAARAGAGIAATPGAVCVLVPSQFALAMPLRVEVRSGGPAEDQADWQQVSEASIMIGENGLSYDSPGCELAHFDIPRAIYRVRIAGAGLVPGATDAAALPGWWRAQLWRNPRPISARTLKTLHVPAPFAGGVSPPHWAAGDNIDRGAA